LGSFGLGSVLTQVRPDAAGEERTGVLLVGSPALLLEWVLGWRCDASRLLSIGFSPSRRIFVI